MTNPPPKKVGLILSSVRPVRVGPHVVDLIHETFKKSPSYSSVDVTIVDIASFHLPVFDEKAMPAMVPAHAQFEHEHSKRWSAEVAKYDGYVFVSPEYNGGVPGGVKNAIDYLYNEWIGKPIYVISYGIHGGATASYSLKRTFETMKLRVVTTRPQLAFVGGPYGADLGKAMLAGQLADETRATWLANANVGKGFEELVEFLNDPGKKGSEVNFTKAEPRDGIDA